MVTLGILLVFFAIVGTTWWFGIWNNLITLVNLILAALIATAFYGNVYNALKGSLSGGTSILHFVSIWLLFVVAFVVIRTMTEIASGRRLKFERSVELAGQSILSIMIACVFISFAVFTLHLSPLPPSRFQADADSRVLGIGPDRLWMAFARYSSRGPLSSSKSKNMIAAAYSVEGQPDGDGELDARVFDPLNDLVEKNVARRAKLAEAKNIVR